MAQQTVQPTVRKQSNPKVEYYKTIWKRLRKNKAAVVGGILILFFIVTSIIGPLFTSYDPNEVDILNKVQGPSAEHWFGTDNFGRDIFTRIIHGMSLTLFVGFFSVVIGGVIGVFFGVISGYYGGVLDTIIMRVMDILLAFPGIILALAIVSVLGGSLTNVIIAVGIFSIPAFARIVRGSTLTVRKLEYIDAVRALGASDARIIFKHILPNVMSPIIVQATLRIATAVLTASGLSFLGLGAKPPTPEWGAMLSDGRSYMAEAPHMVLVPGIMIVLVVLAFNIFGDGLRDALDPKMKK
ncbi:nickel transporter permease [Lederbergia lenta]|uniref:Oligopeptide ABC transporter permease n=1 Tax=Lederbergia lenta TaxID=1467 RepID=A0A2X4VQG3_LEDLE|nr:nickel transporter permease [Lederbergia lenta]MCM3112318.1 ABC transporter permease subunit [Lederbergia lenta]MEC2326538.1 ABC transporter permease subunit [Lederbergia lenta]SQI53213.1 oligopeptide ABC transporter permease [Lederbergia lenta]